MMASYSVAHMKIGMYLKSLGYKFEKERRLNIYLTNSLEPHTANNSANLFFTSVGAESAGANDVKQNRYFSVVIGNPPYSGISKNNDPWISSLIDDYKYVDKEHFNERKHWLNDDYVKFIRFGELLITKNGTGILAFINPHGFLDNPTFRGMRWKLLTEFSKINTIDLHGNSTKKEKSPDGSIDENVFDILQGVTITQFLKTIKKKQKDLSKVFHFDLFGKREIKYSFLLNNSLETVDYKLLKPIKKFLLFVPKNYGGTIEYEKGFRADEIFAKFNTGIVTGIDRLSIFQTKDELVRTTTNILKSTNPFKEYNIKDSRRTSKEGRIEDLKAAQKKGVVEINYRPFDVNFMYLPEKNEHWINSPRIDVMQHFILGDNVGLAIGRQGQVIGSEVWDIISITNKIVDLNYFRRGGEVVFPLYLYSDNTKQTKINGNERRTPNLKTEIVQQIADKLTLAYTNEKEDSAETFAPIDILDYMYAVLHSPTYREKYKEFLKIDFPRIPYPKGKDTFWQLVKLGSEIRQIHLLESPVVDDFITQYTVTGNNIINKKANFVEGKVWINNSQYFDNVPLVSWEFFIGGYQPAQKWLKDRKDRVLSEEDINHYQKIIVALAETDRLMKEIDKIDFLDDYVEDIQSYITNEFESYDDLNIPSEPSN
jgi:predicted helicase